MDLFFGLYSSSFAKSAARQTNKNAKNKHIHKHTRHNTSRL